MADSELTILVWPGAFVPEYCEADGDCCRVIRLDESVSLRIGLEMSLGETDGRFVGIIWDEGTVEMGPGTWNRLFSVSRDAEACLTYGNYRFGTREVELLPMLAGSLRDEFDTGPLWLVDRSKALEILRQLPDEPFSRETLRYGLRLGLMRLGPAVWIPECLSTTDADPSVDLFSYVKAGTSGIQKTMETLLTDHLRRTGAYLSPRTQKFHDNSRYPMEASVVIPIKNRESTVPDAVASALAQQTDFQFNILLVDNHSTDNTPGKAIETARGSDRLHVVTPERQDLGIGGCWNLAAGNELAGKYLVQLDSDDVYATEKSLQALVDLVRNGPWAMGVGSYRTVDMDGKDVSPGIVTHSEWTDGNGHNNILRTSGVGAPRVIATKFLRENPMPNVCYGEDYALALRLSRHYRVARLREVVYLARRWEGNTDFAVEPSISRKRESYKDQLRTLEVQARMRMREFSD